MSYTEEQLDEAKMTKRIPLSNGGYALIDIADYPAIGRFRWKRSIKGYACRTVYKGGGRSSVAFMHRVIMETPKGKECHHQNCNRLDNRRENLVNCSRAENLAMRYAGTPYDGDF